MTERPEMLRHLDRLGTRDFHAILWLSSDASPFATWRILGQTPEIQWLAAHAHESVPEILERIRTRYISDPELAAYFVVLGQAGDPRAVLVLATYVENAKARTNAVMQALLALDKLSGSGLVRGEKREPTPVEAAMLGLGLLPRGERAEEELFRRRAEIAAEARARFEQMSGP